MQRKFDFIDIAGFTAFGLVIILAVGIFELSTVPARPSTLNLGTGWLLVGGLATLWILPLFAQKVPLSQRTIYKNLHRIFGIGFLIVMVLHARSVGYMMLLWLFGAILVLSLVALLHSKIQAINNPLFLKVWWCSHVGMATLITTMSLIHVYAQYAYDN
jgi:hypothetical protein